MTRPLALCIERLAAGPEGESTFTRCVALPVGSEGLGFSANGEVLWKVRTQRSVTFEADSNARLVLTRDAASPSVKLWRRGRSFSLEPGTPIQVLDGDEALVGGTHRFRIHLHGEAPVVSPPELLEIRSPSRSAAPRRRSGLPEIAAAALIGVGSLVGGSSCEGSRQPPAEPDIPVRPMPPIIAVVEEWVRLPVQVGFSEGSAELDEEDRALIRELYQALAHRSDLLRVNIRGHADAQDGGAANEQLARDRAAAVRGVLVDELGMSDEMVELSTSSDDPSQAMRYAMDREVPFGQVELYGLVRRN